MINNLEREQAGTLFKILAKHYAEATHHQTPMAHNAKKGDYIFKEGTISHGVYFIKSGWIKITGHSRTGEEIVLHLATTGEFIGFLSLINQHKYSTSAVTIEEAEVYFIPKQIFTKLVQTNVEFARQVLDMLSERVKRIEKGNIEIRSMDVSQRLASLLLTLEYANSLNSKSKNNYIRLPKKELAAMLSIKPETMSRMLKDFNKQKLIVLHDKSIEVANKEKLLVLSKIED